MLIVEREAVQASASCCARLSPPLRGSMGTGPPLIDATSTLNPAALKRRSGSENSLHQRPVGRSLPGTLPVDVMTIKIRPGFGAAARANGVEGTTDRVEAVATIAAPRFKMSRLCNRASFPTMLLRNGPQDRQNNSSAARYFVSSLTRLALAEMFSAR
jgi:hypothetical protein